MQPSEYESTSTPTDQEGMRERAECALAQLVVSLGSGQHYIVLAHAEHVATACVEIAAHRGEGVAACLGEEADAVADLLARSFTGAYGGMVVRSRVDVAGREILRGWQIRGDWLFPLTEVELFTAYCTHPKTGKPLSPESDVTYSAGIPLREPA
ncbi:MULTISPECIES: hypothetical protein [unclassified Streptomyces]|uniref:hypothetical protein n=1 Tax=unclassified Streptomyces TaxID=2593676 RepID=UPI002DD943EA|nr:hypothetical protein [Streptomyces sp. NBC_01766]WSC24899.1 hypothetical protein OIE60_35105 [Streptomyces sp. NBC_01766]